MAFLELHNIEKRFGSFVAVEHFELNAERGEFVTFLGPSGCGKTTVLRMIAGFEQPTGGQIKINGRDVTTVPANRRNIGMVFQSYALFPNMTVAGNIGFGLKVAGESRQTITARVREMLTLIHMQEFSERYPQQLSGGQQQRVALARALAFQPDMLLLDEPLSALDAKIRVTLRQEIRQIQRQLKITAIFVTHDQEEALSISDRIVVMNKGHVEQMGKPFEIYTAPKTRFVASFIGTLNVLEAQAINAKRVEIDGQPVHLDHELPADRLTKPLTLALRPESISMNGAGSSNGVDNQGGAQATSVLNEMRGVVEDVDFLGSVVRVRVRLAQQLINLDTFNTSELVIPTLGQPVALHFTAEAVMVLQDAS